MNALVWNKQTGHIVSGHRRIELLDELEGSADYLLDVNVVDLPLEREREVNVFLNNPTAQGDYDVTRLAALLKDEEFDKKLAGFDRLDLEVIYSDDELGTFFKTDAATNKVLDQLAEVGGIKAAALEPEPAADGGSAETPPSESDESDLGPNADAQVGDAAEQPAAAERRSDAVKSFMHGRDSENDTETYAVVVFETRREREIFMAACGHPPQTRYIDGIKVFSKLGIDPEGAEWAKLFDETAAQ